MEELVWRAPGKSQALFLGSEYKLGRGGTGQAFHGKMTAIVSGEKAVHLALPRLLPGPSRCVGRHGRYGLRPEGPKKGASSHGFLPGSSRNLQTASLTLRGRAHPRVLYCEVVGRLRGCVHPSVSGDWRSGDNKPSRPISGQDIVSSGWRVVDLRGPEAFP